MWQEKPYTSKNLHQTLEIVDIVKIKIQKWDAVKFEKFGESHSTTNRRNLCILLNYKIFHTLNDSRNVFEPIKKIFK